MCLRQAACLQDVSSFQLRSLVTCCEQWYIAAYMHVVGCRNWSECISIRVVNGLIRIVLMSTKALHNSCAK